MIESFLRDVLPSSANYCGWSSRDKQNRWTDTISELAELVSAETQAGLPGFYYSTASYADEAVVRGNKNARVGELVVGKRDYYLDLDAGEKKLSKHGPDKVYATQRDALSHVLDFLKATKLTPTYIVSSGEGLHIHWCIEEEVGSGEWKPTAAMLSKVARQFGLKEDRSVTCDIARLLRPVGALHDNGKEVKLLTKRGKVYAQEELSSALMSLLPEDDEPELPALPPKRKSSINDEVLQAFQGPPKSTKRILRKCGAMAEVAIARGNVEEPYWRAMLGIVKFTVEGDKAAHLLSSGHPDYSAHETQAKLDNWTSGPTTCAEFAKYCDKCSSCPHMGTIRSPVMLGVMPTEEVAELPEDKKPEAAKAPKPTGMPWDGFIPTGFEVRGSGAHYSLHWNMPVDRENDDGETVRAYRLIPVTNSVFWFSQHSDADDTDDTAQVFMRKFERGTVLSYTLDQTLIANQQKLREFLAGKSIHKDTDKNAAKGLEEYVTQQMINLKALQSMPKLSKRLGVFIDNDGSVKFAQGEHVINPDGTILQGISGSRVRGLSNQFMVQLPKSDDAKWGTEVWDDVITPQATQYVDFMKTHWGGDHQVKYQLAAMLMISSPLMPFVMNTYIRGWTVPTNHGFTVSLYSQDGGYGKTTLMQAAMAAYGLPSSTDKNDSGSTANSRMQIIECSGTLPIALDEMGSLTPFAMANMIRAIANGKGKDRLRSDGSRMEGGQYALVAGLASNKSAMEIIAASPDGETSDAIYHRMLELNVEEDRKPTKAEESEYIKDTPKLVASGGALGAIIARQLCAMGVDKINSAMHGFVQVARQKLGDTDVNARFYERALAAMLMVQVILKRNGMQMFDTDAMVAEFKKGRDRTKGFIKTNVAANDALSQLSRALHDMHGNTVVTMDYTHRRGFSYDKYDEPMNNNIPQVVKARYVHSKGVTYVSTDALKTWMRDANVSASSVIADLKKSGILTSVYECRGSSASPFNLLGGLRVSTGSRVQCYSFDVRKLAHMVGGDEAIPDVVREGNVVQLPLTQPTAEPDQPSEESGT